MSGQKKFAPSFASCWNPIHIANPILFEAGSLWEGLTFAAVAVALSVLDGKWRETELKAILIKQWSLRKKICKFMECFWIYIIFLSIKLWIWVMGLHKYSSLWVSVILQYSLIVTIFRTWDRFPFFLTQGKFSQSPTEGESNLLNSKDSFAPGITSISIHICIFNQNSGSSIKQNFQKGWQLGLWFCFSLKCWFLYEDLQYFLWYNAVCLLLHFTESFLCNF